MKYFVRGLVLCGLFASSSFGQPIPNAGFESWSGGNPTDWFTSNVPFFIMPVTQSTSSHSGSFAVEGTVLWFGSSPYAPLLVSGPDGIGFPMNTRPEAVRGWYTFASDSGDALQIITAFQKNGVGMGFGIFTALTPQAVYQEFVANTTYTTGETPDTGYIYVTPTGTERLHGGTGFKLDDLTFGPASDVREIGTGIPGTFTLEQNYPNPFNPATKIQFQLAEGQHTTLHVYNLLGEKVATLVNEYLHPGRYRAAFDASDLPSGMYFYRLRAGNFSQVKKMTVVK